MPIFRIGPRIAFPPVEYAVDGLLAVGGDLRPERLLLAYRSGIFPWYSEGQPILWHSPDPRTVLLTAELQVPRSLRKTIRKQPYRITLDTCFADVVSACASVKRPGQSGTWITADIQAAYGELHKRGLAHSVEAWQEDRLAGGLYGVSLGAAFFGESMFATAPDGSKVTFVRLVEQLVAWGIGLVDCQVRTPHMARFGAVEWPRRKYVAALKKALARPTRAGRWRFDTAN